MALYCQDNEENGDQENEVEEEEEDVGEEEDEEDDGEGEKLSSLLCHWYLVPRLLSVSGRKCWMTA